MLAVVHDAMPVLKRILGGRVLAVWLFSRRGIFSFMSQPCFRDVSFFPRGCLLFFPVLQVFIRWFEEAAACGTSGQAGR